MSTTAALVITVFIICLTRLLLILPGHLGARPLFRTRKRGSPVRLLTILGSGGHTAEMLFMLRNLDPSTYTHRTWLTTSGDAFSRDLALDFEASLREKHPAHTYGSYDIVQVPRARKIHQSLLTTPFSALRCFIACIRVLRSPSLSPSPISSSTFLPPTKLTTTYTYPDLILANGPGTALILVLAALTLRFLSLPGTSQKMHFLYVESIARVRRLSLTARILVWLGAVDRLVVQWEPLQGVGEYRGFLVF